MEGKKRSEGMGVARVSLRGGLKLVRGTGATLATRVEHRICEFVPREAARAAQLALRPHSSPRDLEAKVRDCWPCFNIFALPRKEVSVVDLERSVEIIETTFRSAVGRTDDRGYL